MSMDFETDTLQQDIPGYQIQSALGRGSMGRVFVARQLVLGRQVAIKFLSVDLDADPVERLARFRREAAIMANLSHPNVLPVFDFGDADDRPYLVMEYVDGGDLRRRMSVGKPMPIEQILRVLRPIAEALAYLHGRGILHRDLKPENILMLGDGTPKVADFGIAVERSGSGELTRSGQGLGTLGYVAPEQQYRLPVDERADQYSLAAMTYEMLTGQRPLGVFKPPSHYNPSVSCSTNDVLIRGLQEDPSDRYPDVMTFCRAFEKSIEGQVNHPRPLWKPLAMLGLVVASALLGALAFWAFKTLIISRAREPLPPPAAAKPEPPPVEPVPLATPAPERGESDNFRLLQSAAAHQIWVHMGKPLSSGKGIDETNWFEAKAHVYGLVEERAYDNFRKRGGDEQDHDPKKSRKDWDQAEEDLVKEYERVVKPRAK